ncbi:glycosyltransferase [Bacillus dakarensis]|uniref:glycosyltransferase n=1 Tax=Robertmurraya dakarensis TaxID=1926278 RepID=UPI003B0137C9
MMKEKQRILISTFDMEIGGVERSLIGLLNHIDYDKYDVDLMLFKHEGEFLPLLPKGPNLLPEIPQYSTFRSSIGEILKNKQYGIGFSRILSKMHANFIGKITKAAEPGYYQMQLMWKYALPFLPKMDTEYDVAISYLWPHYFVGEKVNAKKKIAWIHTDYSTVETNVKLDLKMWNKFDHIAAVSESCKQSFLKKYCELSSKVMVMENITSPEFIRKMAEETVENPMENDQRFKILTVARLSHAKGIDHAVMALKLLKEKGYDNISWYVVGYGGDEVQIRGLIKELSLENSFILLGKKTNPYPYMKEADLYVQPSRYEGKAVTVSEAQILSKPVVITNYATAKSQVKDGYDGYITDLSVEGIAAGIEKAYQTPSWRQELANNCRKTNYGNNKEVEKLYSLLG